MRAARAGGEGALRGGIGKCLAPSPSPSLPWLRAGRPAHGMQARLVPPPDQRARAYARHRAALVSVRASVDTRAPATALSRAGRGGGKKAALADAERLRMHTENAKLLRCMQAILSRPPPQARGAGGGGGGVGGGGGGGGGGAHGGSLNLGARRAAVTSMMSANLVR